MKALHDLGYTTISIDTLVEAILNGKALPAHAVVISFDDGNLDVYQNAFPVMKKYSFTGTLFIVAGHLAAKDCMGVTQIKEMITAGWEVGSHSMTHPDLTKAKSTLSEEMTKSKSVLSEKLGVNIAIFAYPYGAANQAVEAEAQKAGYRAAVGLGDVYRQSTRNLYFLGRTEIQNSYDMEKFANLLPWRGNGM